MCVVLSILADRAKRENPAEFARCYRSRECGYQDRLNGLAPQSTDADYFRGYCEALCNEIDDEAGRNERVVWWGLAD